jgi:hypothetical protein
MFFFWRQMAKSLVLTTELYRINRERHRFLGNEAKSQQHFVTFAAPSSGQIWQIYKGLFSKIVGFDR